MTRAEGFDQIADYAAEARSAADLAAFVYDIVERVTGERVSEPDERYGLDG